MPRLGVVSFLNARPLVDGLESDPGVVMVRDVPAALPTLLEQQRADAALIPLIDVIRSAGRYVVLSNACIGCDGETMTVRVFSQMPPDRITRLAVDADSHTSVALARVLWRELYGCDLDLEVVRPAAPQARLDAFEAVLLIGDKVVDPRRAGFAYEVDLGGAWRQHTGLPFVFAVWAGRRRDATIEQTLEAARDRGLSRAAEIARVEGPRHGWSVELAERYLVRCLKFTLDGRAVAGANRFAASCAAADLAPQDATIDWPDRLLKQAQETGS